MDTTASKMVVSDVGEGVGGRRGCARATVGVGVVQKTVSGVRLAFLLV